MPWLDGDFNRRMLLIEIIQKFMCVIDSIELKYKYNKLSPNKVILITPEKILT